GRVLDRDRQLLEAAREMDVPDVVAEVAPQLAEDRRHRVGGERLPAGRIEAVDRLHQADARDLDQVLERLATALVAHRKRPRQGHEPGDELLADPRITAVGEAAEKGIVGTAPLALGLVVGRVVAEIPSLGAADAAWAAPKRG